MKLKNINEETPIWEELTEEEELSIIGGAEGIGEVKTIREFNGNELKVTASVGNVVSVRVYNRL